LGSARLDLILPRSRLVGTYPITFLEARLGQLPGGRRLAQNLVGSSQQH